jgi:glycosyltransferase involved in cell wall biosynthesis
MSETNKKSKAESPWVTIGIPTYNSNGSILGTLQSIWDQQYPNLEIIVSDNCSTDNTQHLIEELMREHPEIRYYRQPRNIGLVPNFEFVRGKATGDLFMWAADDDALEPGILKVYVDFLQEHPDYSLVSGQIKYWLGNRPLFCEKDFNMEESSGDLRVVHYYFKVMYGAIFHGLMRRKAAQRIPLRNVIGNDFHFVATLAYMGKIKTLERVGYNKRLNGTSRNFEHYAHVIGASRFAARFPRLAIARDAFAEIFNSPIFAVKRAPSKLLLALSCGAGVLISYYGREFPFILGGMIKRLFTRPFTQRSTV